MRRFANKSIGSALAVGLCLAASFVHGEGSAGGVRTIRRISVLTGSVLELEIAASGPVKPTSQVIQGPDRLILDFPGAVPARGLHTLEINRGDVKDARIGLFSSNPPVTRVVLDLKSAQPYELFPSGNTVVVKFGSNAAVGVEANRSAPVADADAAPETIVSIERSPIATGLSDKHVQPVEQARATAPALAVPAQNPRVEVAFENGLLSIRANKASLSEVLSEVRRRTGADISIPAGAESEQVFTSLGPGAPKEVLASLLNGSHFNFIVVGSERDPGGIRRVVLTPKEGGTPQAVVYPCGSAQPAMAQAAPDPEPPVQAFGTPMPPEQSDPGDAQEKQPPPPQ
ncbi:MAG: AMIN domain-containing protein [Terriglobales bacterium]